MDDTTEPDAKDPGDRPRQTSGDGASRPAAGHGEGGDDREHIGTVAPTPDSDRVWRGTPLWRRFVALFGLGSVAIVGGLLIAIAIAAAIGGMAVLVQQMIG